MKNRKQLEELEIIISLNKVLMNHIKAHKKELSENEWVHKSNYRTRIKNINTEIHKSIIEFINSN
ncbi:MAG TPA: hypothetical protein VMZ91_13645 [Candidatus Paceibacterota bacterium]|nr:hypothetical protein [Candidatus Paceibacterota bacterium]